MATARKSFNETENNSNSMFSNEEIQKLIEENKKLRKQNETGINEEEKLGKNLWGYVIALTSANNKNSSSKGVDFGHNGIIYHVDFGTPTEVPCSVVETLELHIQENTRQDGGRLNISNIHYTFSKLKEVWR